MSLKRQGLEFCVCYNIILNWLKLSYLEDNKVITCVDRYQCYLIMIHYGVIVIVIQIMAIMRLTCNRYY